MAKVHVKSFGCSENMAEGEMMAGLLQKEGHTCASADDSDTIVLNICTVKGPKVALREIREAIKQNPNKKIVVGGCVTKDLVQPIRALKPDASILTTNTLTRIGETVSAPIPITLFDNDKAEKVGLPRVKKNPVIGIIPIEQGCLDACAFCSTRLVKGRLRSYAPERIISEARTLIAEGCKELWLTGQDTGCYGFDINTNLALLVKSIVALPGEFYVRIGMGNPRHLSSFLPELVAVLKHPKAFKFIHLPIQSGNSEVLKSMKRQHTLKECERILTEIRREIPDITISTDIIVGFAGETNNQFNDTAELVKKHRFDNINISRFVSRPGTLAHTLPEQIPAETKKERSRLLTTIVRSTMLEKNRQWISWEGDVLVDEPGTREGTWMARNYAYKLVVLTGDYELGQKVRVKVTDAVPFHLIGEEMQKREETVQLAIMPA